MECVTDRARLRAALDQVAAVTSGKMTKDILKSVRMSCTGDRLNLLATNEEVWISADVDCKAAGPFECLLPTAKLQSILSELTHPEVTLDAEDGRLFVRSQLSEFRLATEGVGDFPPMPNLDGQDVEVSAADLTRLLQRTVFATDTESERYSLGGVRFEFSYATQTLVCAATDTRRLSVDDCSCTLLPAAANNGTEFCGVIPAKAVHLLLRMLSASGSAPARIGFGSNQWTFRVGSYVLATRLVQGRFPDWRKVVPKCDSRVALTVGPFYRAIRQSMIVRNEESRGVRRIEN